MEEKQAGNIIKSLASVLELVPSENLEVANTIEPKQNENGPLVEVLVDCLDVVPNVVPLENGLVLNEEYLGYGHVSELVGCSMPLDKTDDFSLDDLTVSISSLKKAAKKKRYNNKGSIECDKLKKTNSAVRRRRKLRKKIRETLDGEKDLPVSAFDMSISDINTDHRNALFSKKAEATWDVSSTLGLVFNKDNKQMVNIFRQLEEDDRKGLRGSV